MSRCLSRLSAALFLMGVGLLISAHWITVKAQIAQWLILDTWEASLASPHQPLGKPWPWADWEPVARLSLPGSQPPMIVLSGIEGASLAFGPGLHPQGARPGETGTIVIAGHRDTHFKALQSVVQGAELQLQTRQGKWRTFVVRSVSIVDSNQESLILETNAGTHLKLITCYPFDAIDPGGPLRYVVSAEERTTII